MVTRISLYIVAALLVGAHFLRAGSYLLAVLCLAVPLLFFYRRGWSLVVLQMAAYAATIVWLWTALALLTARQQSGQPWTVAAVILGAVALFTSVCGLLLNARCLRERYPTSSSS